jgi:hypothetical protein
LVVFVVEDKEGRFSLGLDESFGIEPPFREFNVPTLAGIGIDRSKDSFVQKGWGSKVFGIFRKVICVFQWKSDKVMAK